MQIENENLIFFDLFDYLPVIDHIYIIAGRPTNNGVEEQIIKISLLLRNFLRFSDE